MKIFSAILIACLFIASSCKKEEAAKITPANLTVQTTTSSDGSGLVTFHATAEKADHYIYYFGDSVNTPTSSDDGMASHTYSESGTYFANVSAVSADNLSIEESVSVTIQVDEPAINDVGYSTPTSYPAMTLVWSDEFNGTALNTDDWNYEIGGSGWGNNELEYYQPNNTAVQDGFLIIKAKQQEVGGRLYTSSRLTTQGKQAFQYGRIDIRAQLPKGQGIWPALWMLGTSITTEEWPRCGEIDIMEMIGGGEKDSTIYGTAHWDSNGYASYGGHRSLFDGSIFADEFHVFSIVWTETSITWYLDDVQYHVIDITPGALSELRASFFFIFNVAVGGNWPGSPDANTVFPQRMVVDYVRVFE